jgi:peroxygenase
MMEMSTMKQIRIAALVTTLMLAGCGQAPSATGDSRVAVGAAAAGKSQTALQRHVAYFDRNGDGLIKPSESMQAIKDLGVGAIEGRVLATGLHAVLGPKTSGKLTTDITIANIHVGVHPGSINFDQQGQFKPAQFQAMFADYDTNRSGALSRSEVFAMLKARKKTAVSYTLSRTAFTVLLAVASDTEDKAAKGAEPALSRARMQAFYDGSLFPTIAKERASQARQRAVDLQGVELSPPTEAIEHPMP